MTSTLLRRALPTLLLIVVGGGLVWNTVLAGDDEVLLTATFDDVVDLVPRAHVRTADVPIGTVSRIELTDDNRAAVTMEVRRETGLPNQVVAVLKKTSLLGERYVSLEAADGASGSLDDGGEVVATDVIDDFEDLVRSGNDVVGVIAAQQLAQAVEVGAVAFGGRGSVLGSVLGDLEATVGDYNEGREHILRLIDASDRLLADMAADAEANAAVLADLDRAAQALDREDEALIGALEDLARLADVGERILRTNRDSLDGLVRRLHLLVAELTRIDGALGNVLRFLPRHNLHVANGILQENSQVWNDFVVCGVHDEPDNPANSCTPPNPGESNAPPPEYGIDDCDLFHEGCPYEDVDPRTRWHTEERE
ncbi:MAG: MlaD family protein [Nitriliruptorales bacterium]|nr:MlaD family protein [Nitriliruptorales bacterium]